MSQKASNKKLTTSPIFLILNKKKRNVETLIELVSALKEISLLQLNTNDASMDGTFLHFLTKTAQINDEISWRMVYALSNAGLNVNSTNAKGNTALHMAFMRGYTEIDFDFIEALLKVGSDLRIKNSSGKLAVNYMEQNEQFVSIYSVHSPSIWESVEFFQLDDIYRLMNAWIKVNSINKKSSLIEFAKEKSNDNPNNKVASSIVDILETCRLSNDFVHAMFSFDLDLMNEINNKEGFKLNPNMGDYCYCFTWYNLVFRNLPRFIMEIAFDTKQDSIIKFLLSQNANVNLFHSKKGYPIYFLAYEEQFRHHKIDILKNANLKIKNYRGESALFYLHELYLRQDENNEDHRKYLLNEFNETLFKDPMLISERNQEDISLIEKILTMNSQSKQKSIEFLVLISKFLQKMTDANNVMLFQNMIIKSYGIVLVNIPIYIDLDKDEEEEASSGSLPFKEYLETSDNNNNNEISACIKHLVRYDFMNMINNFFRAIKIGDLNALMMIIEFDKRKCILKTSDYSGRSCLHVAVLYSRNSITKFLLEKDPDLIQTHDNLGRTPLHYAYAIRDTKLIQLLIVNKANEEFRDCKFLLPEEYSMEEVMRDDWFGVRNFRDKETRRVNGYHSYIRGFEYEAIRAAIEQNDSSKLAEINLKLSNYGLGFKDLPHYKLNNCWIGDALFEPPLEMAIRCKSVTAFRYILENTFTDAGKRNIRTARIQSAYDSEKTKRIKSAKNVTNKVLDLPTLRQYAEDLDLEEIIDIIDNIGEEPEITKITDPNVKIAEKQDEMFQNGDYKMNSEGKKQKTNFCNIV